MMHHDALEIRPTGPLRAKIRPPGSKSITNRALVCAALADGESVLIGALDSEDTRAMIEALRLLGIAVDHDPARRGKGDRPHLPKRPEGCFAQMGPVPFSSLGVAGCGGNLPARQADLYVANSGTTVRLGEL